MGDVYQDRYVAHQQRKAAALRELIAERHSERMFAEREVPTELLSTLVEVADRAPSSCDRHGVTVTVTTDRDAKALLGGLLVGGVGWVHRAPAVLLLIADPEAYKAPGELGYMPFLDAGIIVGHMYLAAVADGLSCCFVNPNIREPNRAHFSARFGPGVFCGAMAIGWPRGPDPEWVGDTS